MTSGWAEQADYAVRFEWGPVGARVLAGGCSVIVDVLSFTTSVTVAVERGTRVFPHAWRDHSASEFAERNDAVLAVGRSAVSTRSPWSLSPAALLVAPVAERLVLPSPNGSAIAEASGDGLVIAGCLRNADAVAESLVRRGFATGDRPVSVIAAGERWPDGSLRPALEDLLGAGAIISALHKRSCSASPEAASARASYEATTDIAAAIADCASGQELIGIGFAEDVAIAARLNTTGTVPLLRGGAFSACRD